MQSTNRSGLQCYEHPREQVTNFCVNIDCLKPLCPDCVEIHTKNHQKQEILSWKHCISDAAIKMKSTLDQLRELLERHRLTKGPKSPENVETQNIQRLAALKEKCHRLVDEIFSSHQNTLRARVRQLYRADQPDTSKLKVAIEEIQKVIMKLAHPSSSLPALKKALLLDRKALLQFFGHLRSARPAAPQELFFTQGIPSLAALRNDLERCVIFEANNVSEPVPVYSSSYDERRYSNLVSMGQWQDTFQSLKVTVGDYFRPDCRPKSLHFFVPCSFQLKTINLQQASRGTWRTIQFKAKKQLPCYFKSITTPSGEIYLTGGSEQDRRCRQIYRYNLERNSLDFVCNMLIQRSSHSICYLDNRIYLIGGFSGAEGDVTRDCEVFDLETMACSRIAPLNTPSANSAAASFSGQFILKFGGILNKSQGNSLIQMYSVRNNRWIVVNIESPRGVPHLDLLSFSAAVQINERDIIVFGGYDNTELQRPQRLCYALSVWPQRNAVRVRNYNTTPLPFAQGFWSNNPIVQGRCVFALQNITDEQDELTALADERKVLIFNGQRWI